LKYRIVVILFIAVNSHAQKSAALNKFANYLPSLTEVGYITGAVNCYLQAASLVRTVNREIALAKTLNERLGALQQQAKDMYGQFQDLSQINPYDMDSWANWLNRADQLSGYEMGQFTFILGNQILRTIDQKLSVDFVHEIERARTYEVKDNNFKEVISRYFMRTSYVDYQDKIQQAASNNDKVAYLSAQQQALSLRGFLKVNQDPNLRRILQEQLVSVEEKIRILEERLRTKTFDISSADKQIAFITDMAQSLAHDMDMLQGMLETHQKNLVGLNKAWRETIEGRLAKDKRVDGVLAASALTRPIYDSKDADRVSPPDNNPDKPTSANVSHTASPTNMGDILFLQNKIDFERLAMAQTSLLMELLAANGKATFIAAESGKRVTQMNARSAVTFGAENNAHYINRRL
jgi:DNA-binding transcriptional MerR regulator